MQSPLIWHNPSYDTTPPYDLTNLSRCDPAVNSTFRVLDPIRTRRNFEANPKRTRSESEANSNFEPLKQTPFRTTRYQACSGCYPAVNTNRIRTLLDRYWEGIIGMTTCFESISSVTILLLSLRVTRLTRTDDSVPPSRALSLGKHADSLFFESYMFEGVCWNMSWILYPYLVSYKYLP